MKESIIREQRVATAFVRNEGYGDWVYSSATVLIPEGWHYYNHIEQGPNTANPQQSDGSWSHEVIVARDNNFKIISLTIKLGARGRNLDEGRIWLGYSLVVIVEKIEKE